MSADIDPRELRRRAEEHAPRTDAEVQAAARQLLRDGHSEHTAAAILKLDVNSLRRLVGR